MNAEPAGSAVAHLLKDLHRILKLGQDRVRVLQQSPAGFRDVDPAVHPLKQPGSVKALQLPDGLAHRGLGHVQLLRRGSDALLLTDGPEDLQMAQSHGLPPDP